MLSMVEKRIKINIKSAQIRISKNAENLINFHFEGTFKQAVIFQKAELWLTLVDVGETASDVTVHTAATMLKLTSCKPSSL